MAVECLSVHAPMAGMSPLKYCMCHDVTHYDTLAVIFPIVSHVMIQSDEAGFLVMLCKKLIMYEKSRT